MTADRDCECVDPLSCGRVSTTGGPGSPGPAVMLCGCSPAGQSASGGGRPRFGRCAAFSASGRLCSRCPLGGCRGALVEPGFEDVQVAGDDEVGDREGLGDLSRCAMVFRIPDVDLAAVEAAANSFVVAAGGRVGRGPGGGQIVVVLPEPGAPSIDAGIGGDRDVGLAADGRKFFSGWRDEPTAARRMSLHRHLALAQRGLRESALDLSNWPKWIGGRGPRVVCPRACSSRLANTSGRAR